MITFTQEEAKTDKPTFKDVKENQFFINYEGCLCQKSGYVSYIYLAKGDGTPYATWVDDADEDEAIRKLLPNVTKVNFN